MRGVRYRQLSPNEVDQASLAAGTGAPQGMSMVAYMSAYQRAGAIAMLVSYTEPLGPEHTSEGLKDPDLSKATWKSVDHTQMEVSFGTGAIFNAKDTSILMKIFTRMHEANMMEVETIMGKASSVL